MRQRGFRLGSSEFLWNLVFRVFEELDPTAEQWDAFRVAMMGLMGSAPHRPTLLQVARFSGWAGFGPVTGLGAGLSADKGVAGRARGRAVRVGSVIVARCRSRALRLGGGS